MEYEKYWQGVESFVVEHQLEVCHKHANEELGNALHRLKQTRDAYEIKVTVEGKNDAETLAILSLLKHHYLQALNALKVFESFDLIKGYDRNDNTIYDTNPEALAEMHQAYQYYLNYHASIKEWVGSVITLGGIAELKFKKRLPGCIYEEDLIERGKDPKLYDLDEE